MKKTTGLTLFLCILWCFFSPASYAQPTEKVQEPPKKTRLLFLLDASGSMSKDWEGNSRMTTAKNILTHLVDSLENSQHLELGLRVYGSQFTRHTQHCEESKLLVPFGPENHSSITKKLNSINPMGSTPIAFSLKKAANDYPSTSKDVRNVIIIITDGRESCGGDPCEVSMALQRKDIFLKPFVVGIGMNEDYSDAFGCMGHFFSANDVSTFKQSMNEVIRQTLSETKVIVNLLDVNNQPTETNVNVTFMNSVTQEAKYDFVHYITPEGNPDAMKVDPVTTYDIKVNTIPPVTKENVFLEGGKVNYVDIKTPRGSLFLKQKGYRNYEGLKAIIRQNGKMRTLNVQDVGNHQKYLVGTYDIEVLTVPRMYYNDVKISQSKTNTVNIPMPGMFTLKRNMEGYGSIYQLKKDGTQELVYKMQGDNDKTNITMQPGRYKVVFRSKNTRGSEYTTRKYFEIKPGESTRVELFPSN